MKRSFFKLFTLVLMLALGSLVAFAQAPTSTLSGSVTDQSGAVVANATVTVKNNGTGAQFKTTTSNNGTFTIPQLSNGVYTVTIAATGFKQSVVQDVKIDTATPASIPVALEVGQQSESVVVQGGADILQTQSANISTTITGRQITELPFSSRDALDLVLLLPGTSTPGRPRTSTINGLPKGALNITLDGVNVQDNTLKSSDGFFTYVRPRIDAVDEVTVSTATPGAESSGEGAVQIKFVTRSGNNDFHGSIYEYHRNPSLNSNYWFNNKSNIPRTRVLLNQYGFRAGGPFWAPKKVFGPASFDGRDKAFFFINYEEYRLPEQTLRQRTIFTPDAQAGIYKYSTSSGIRSVNLLTLAGAQTIDPSIANVLSQIRQSTNGTGAIEALTDPNFQRFTFVNTGGQVRKFPTVRLDFNLSSKHHLENIYNFNLFDSTIDFLNNVDPAFPGFPNYGSQVSNRFSNVTALRSTLTPSLVNEVRFGLTGGSVTFFPEVAASNFASTNGYALNINAAGITNYYVTRGPQRRNAPVWQLGDTVSLTKGAHSLNFGVNYTIVNFWQKTLSDGVVRQVGFGLASNDPAQSLFTVANFQGASTTQLSQARSIYSTLIGSIASVTGNIALDEQSNQYSFAGDVVQRASQKELGFFVQDSWRVRPTLTVNAGLRWEIQLPFTAKNDLYSQTQYEDLWGISGVGNMFKPGTLTGKTPTYTQFKQGDLTYNTDWSAFAPSLGFAWTPSGSGLGKLFGSSGQTVIRGGYSIAYNREGMNVLTSILGANPGITRPATRNVTLTGANNIPISTLLRNGVPGPPAGLPTAPAYPFSPAFTESLNAFLPDLKTGYVQSWTFGIQRELGRDTALEIRYVGNHGTKLWRQTGLNELNNVESGFYNEFIQAQRNLTANNAAGGTRANSFAYFGPNSGTSPLPIILAHFNGIPVAQAGDASKYTSTNFTNATYRNFLDATFPSVGGFSNNLLQNQALFLANTTAAGLPANLFVVNPAVAGNGSFLIDNGGNTTYNSLVVELRRRLSKGLLVQGSYAFSRGFTNMFVSSATVFSDYTTRRNVGLNKSLSPFALTHALKANWIYELPFGRSKAFGGDVGGVTNAFIGGWEFHGTARLQSGSPFSFGNVDLVGMTREDLQEAVKINKGASVVTFLPDDIIENTKRAYGSLTDAAPSGRYISPTNRNRPVAYAGQYGISNLVLYGPKFFRFDLSAVKRFKITETINFELRGEFPTMK